MPEDSPTQRDPIPVERALATLAAIRLPGQVVVTNQMSARLWPCISDGPLDLNYNPSTMGGAVPLALGLALARPLREMLVVSGEGALLMNLGCLVTVIDSGVANLTIVLLDNGMYEVTGGQRTPASKGHVDFAGLARAAGFTNVSRPENDDDWRQSGPRVLARGGPRFIWLQVSRGERRAPLKDRRSVGEQAEDLRSSLMRRPNEPSEKGTDP